VLQNLGKGVQPNLAISPNPASLQNRGTTVVRHATFREAASVIANPETGVLSIRATSRPTREDPGIPRPGHVEGRAARC